MREYKNFWDRNAGLYDCFMRKDRAVYEKMYELIRPVVKDKTVLEVATGTQYKLLREQLITGFNEFFIRRMNIIWNIKLFITALW